ncbi:MAG: M28 family peptidase [Bacteroidetes bacterium]|nr:M28 family peptidase [Bacteroidota bacterium]
MLKNLSYLFLASVLVFASCNQEQKTDDSNHTKPDSTEVKPANGFGFNEDSAYQSINTQVGFGARIPNTEAQEKCAAYLYQKLKTYMPDVVMQETKVTAYNGTSLKCKNILAYFHKERKNRILLCSHWDTRPWADQEPDPKRQHLSFDGANDGPSGVGVILEMARIITQKDPGVGVDIVFFDVEDYGAPEWEKVRDDNTFCLGTQHWANTYPKDGNKPKFGILLDMVGARNSRFLMEGKSMQFAKAVVENVWQQANNLGYGNLFISQPTAGITDDHIHINETAKIPTIDIVDYDALRPKGFADYWHTTADNMSIIDKATLKAVGETLLGVVYGEGK